MDHTAQTPTNAFRTLENPPARLPLAPHLSYSLANTDLRHLISTLRRTLRAHGDSLDRQDHITIAYPHKHPHLGRHINAAQQPALSLKNELEYACHPVKFPLARALYETVHLGRSEDQSTLHALTGRQIYKVDPLLQNEPLPFITDARRPREYFIIVDWMAVQGTTIANLASFITHNGGTVLAAVTGSGEQRLAQSDDVEPGNEHLPPTLRAGMVPALAHAFNRATGHKIPPGTCAQMVEDALQPHGRSLRTLTTNEGEKLLRDITTGTLTFKALIDGLNRALPPGTPAPPKPLNWPYAHYR